MNDKLTVLICTSPIPSHPSTDIIDNTIKHIRKYTDAVIVIMIDGIHHTLEHRREDYKQYILKLYENNDKGKYGLCRLEYFDEHLHQSGMTKKVLESVTTPLIFFVEHDCFINGEIPFDEICYLVENFADINYMRFNIFNEILKEHEYLMLNDAGKWTTEINGEIIQYVKTLQYSQRPHIAKTKWYKDILWTYFQDTRSMIEDRMHSIVIEKYKALGFDTFGLTIYTPKGDQTRSFTTDGRGTDKKVIGI